MIEITKMSAAIMLMVAALLANSIPVGAQQPAVPVVGTWDAIKALPSRDRLTITLKDGNSKKGKLTDVTETAVMLSQGNKITEIRRDGIFQIYRAVPKSREKATWVGAAVGAGLATASVTFSDGSNRNGRSARAAVIGILFVTGLGALIGRSIAGGEERVLIYEARK